MSGQLALLVAINEVRSGSKVLGLVWKGGSGVEGQGLFWRQRLEMFLESGGGNVLGIGEGNVLGIGG